MEEESSSIAHPCEETPYDPSAVQIPIDLFVSKKFHTLGIGGHVIRFIDSSGNLAYTVRSKPSQQGSSADHHRRHVKQLLDSHGNVVYTISRLTKKSWKGYRGSNADEKELVFSVNKTVNESTRTEFEILSYNDNNEGSKNELRMKGCPFKRSCTIYQGDSIVVQTSLMYKLGFKKIFVPRSRFRVTIFPGFNDHGLAASLVFIFLHGRKLWI